MNINMNDWINSPLLKDIDPVKLELIKMAASQTSGKSGKDLAPVMLALITSANKKGIRFTAEEIQLILEILKDGKPAFYQRGISAGSSRDHRKSNLCGNHIHGSTRRYLYRRHGGNEETDQPGIFYDGCVG